MKLSHCLNSIEYIEGQIKEVETRILALWETVKDKHYLQTIPGISDLMAHYLGGTWKC